MSVDYHLRPNETLVEAQHILVVDLEATCDSSGFPRAERETIEIGAVLVESISLDVVDEFQCFIRPIRHPTLTDYCVQLTNITQAMVDSAAPFDQGFTRFIEGIVRGRDLVFASWGGYDRRQLKRDCLTHGLEYPFETYLDLSIEFTQHAGLPRRASMARALESVGLLIEGSHHRGIDDARNLTRLLPWCLGRRPIPTCHQK